MRRLILAALVAAGCSAVAARAGEQIPLDKVPEKIAATVKDRFPEGELKSVEKENEDGKVMFDVELTAKGRKYEMDVKEDGRIVEIEKEVAAKDFPDACAKAVAAKYPQATIKEIMEVNKVDGKTETPIHYEVVLDTPGKKSFEAIVALDGKSVEEEKEEAPATK
jgi:hypothetical protein